MDRSKGVHGRFHNLITIDDRVVIRNSFPSILLDF